jgi:hypothetical protein
LHYVRSFFEKIPLNNDIESNNILSSLNYKHNNFICSFNLNTFDISPLKLNSSLEENFHMLNKESQNINNTENKNVNEKTCSYFEDKKNLVALQQNKFTQIMKDKSKDKHIVKYKTNNLKTLQNMFAILVKTYVLCTKSNIKFNYVLINFL